MLLLYSAWIQHSDLLKDKILRKHNIKKKGIDMNYHNYEGKIMEKYGVALNGCPTGFPGVCNPSMVGSQPMLEKLLSTLESSQCHWVLLTGDELEARKKDNQARDEHVYKPRKSTKRSRTAQATKSSATVDDSDEDKDEDEDEDKDL